MIHFMSPLRVPRARLAVVALVCLAACGGNPITPPPPPPPQPDPIALTCPATVEVSSPEGLPVAVPYVTPIGTGQAPLSTTCAPASDTLFAVGTTKVSCTVVDALNRSVSCSFDVRVIGPPRLTHTRFLAFGDSMTWGTDAPPVRFLLDPAPPHAYPNQLESRLRIRYRFQTQVLSVINDGLPAEYAASPNPIIGSPGGVRRLQTAIPYYRPEVLLLMEGTNDLLFGQAGVEDAVAALRTMVQTAKGQGLRVCLATIPPQRLGTRINAPLVAVLNDRIRALALAEQVVLVDVYNALKDNLAAYIGTDDLHPTLAGFDKITETFFEAIKANFEQQTSQPGGIR